MQSKILLYVISLISFFSCQLLKQQKTYLKTNLKKAEELKLKIESKKNPRSYAERGFIVFVIHLLLLHTTPTL